MPKLTILLSAAVMLLLSACADAGNGGGGGPQPDPTDIKPSAIAVLAMSDDFGFTFMPDAPLAELEWDVEIEYDTSDVEAVFAYYDAQLLAEGFTQTDLERSGDEVEANYEGATGLTVELEVEREDDDDVQVDMDTDDFGGPFPTGFTLTEFAGFATPIYPDADVRDVEWDFNFDHPETDPEAVFTYYDDLLQSLGWNVVEIDDDDDDEREVEYRFEDEDVYLELEVEEDDAGTEVELEFNKLRFYQN